MDPSDDGLTHILEERRIRLQRAIDLLPELNRSALLLRFFEGHDADDVAHALDIPVLDAHSLIIDGLRRLRALL